jgi:3-isopropylmalate dehydratase small subunit
MTKPMTLTQKILAHHAVGLRRPWVEAGDLLQIRVDWTITSELAWNGMDRTYELLGRPKLHNKDRVFLAVDHTVDPVTLLNDPRTQKLVELSRSFAREASLKHFYDANQTILHTKFYRDLIQPGEVVLGADSHSTSHGGMGAFAIGLGGADITAAMVLGQSWLEVPDAIAVEYIGRLPFGFGGKEVILKTLGQLGRNTVALERSVEFFGEATRDFSIDTRFTIANMTAEFGGLNGIFEADEKTAYYLSTRQGYNQGALYFRADKDAPYLSKYTIDLANMAPIVAKPFSPDNTVTVEEGAGQKLDGVFIGACTTTEEELILGALVLEQALRTQTPKASERRRVTPGSTDITERLQERGLLEIYRRAGFQIGAPGCSMCLGVASEKAGKGEVWLSSQNRNYPNRMGEGSIAWLSSAATVAASALGLEIADPRPLLAQVDQERYHNLLARKQQTTLPAISTTSPSFDLKEATSAAAGGAPTTEIVASKVQRFGNDIDTDAIIPGAFCHLTSLQELGEKSFHFVRPEFVGKVKGGARIIVAERGWGSGSSREQAVWALKGIGIQAIIAQSFAYIHKRNLVNEGVPHLVIDDPAFYALAQEGATLSVDTSAGLVTHVESGKTFTAKAPSPIASALAQEGGLVSAIQHHGHKVMSVLAAR